MTRLFLLAAMMSGIVELSDGWRPVPRPDGDLRYRALLPATLPDDPRIVFRGYASRFDLFVEQQRIYSFDENAARHQLRLHVAPLPRDAAGKHLYLRIPAGGRPPFFGGIPLIASPADVPRALVRVATDPLDDNLLDIVIGVFLLVIGIASMAVSRMRRGESSEALLWFGVFATLYGLRLVLESYVLRLAGVSTLQAEYAEAIVTYVIPIPGWVLARKLIGDGWKSTLRWQVWAFTIFAPIGITADIVRGDPGSLEVVNNVLVVTGGVNILGNLVYVRARLTRELRVILAGAVVFMLFALVNNLAALGILPFEDVDETPGFVIFVATLFSAAVRMFVRGERARVALEGELATARDIQRSILPTSMPQVNGLRLTARYAPASTVAGDLYDFLVVDDERVGVLVADVAGHGIPAALIASMVKVVVSSHAELSDDPGALLGELNAALRRDVRRNFVTATYLWLDMNERCVSVSNAGHPAPLLFRGNDVHELGPTGVLLGRFAATYESHSVPLLAGDRIAVYTDGVVESRNARGEDFGELRLCEILRGGGSAEDVIAAVERWRGANVDHDDLTIVVIDVV
jgi:sigma-B regulation protein RsbU (phosphoserine phosphatase)